MHSRLPITDVAFLDEPAGTYRPCLWCGWPMKASYSGGPWCAACQVELREEADSWAPRHTEEWTARYNAANERRWALMHAAPTLEGSHDEA